MPSVNQKRYHASIGKSVTLFMVGDAERLAVFLRCKMTRLAHRSKSRMLTIRSLLREERTCAGHAADDVFDPNEISATGLKGSLPKLP
jgi:hypothetical protein